MATRHVLSLSMFFFIFGLKLSILAWYYFQMIQETSRNNSDEIVHVLLPLMNEISLKRRKNLPPHVQGDYITDNTVISEANYYCPLRKVFAWCYGWPFEEIDIRSYDISGFTSIYAAQLTKEKYLDRYCESGSTAFEKFYLSRTRGICIANHLELPKQIFNYYYQQNVLIVVGTRCNRKWSRSRVTYYNNSIATFHLLLRSGDVEENPGPQNNNKQKAPCCVECEKPVAKNHKRTLCTKCFDTTHAKCTRFLDPKVVSSVAPVDWTCLKCTFNALPFSLHNLDDTEIEAGEQYSSTTLNTSDICSILNQHPKHLKIMHLNTQSMISTFNEFLLTVSQYSFDVFTLSETWLKNNPYLLEYVSIPGYSAVFRNCDAIKGGGVGAYIRESLHFKRREDIEKLQPDFEHLWLEFP